MKTYTFRLTSEGFAELQKNLTGLGDQGEAALLRLEQAAPGFGAAMEAAAKKAEASRQKLEATMKADLAARFDLLDGAVKASEKNFKSLHASLDPAVAAQQQLARGREVVTDALKRGAVSEQDATRVNKLLEQQYQRSTTSLGGFGTGISTVSRLLGAFGVALSVGSLVSWGKQVFSTNAQLVDQAKQLQQSTDALQAYRAEFAASGSSADFADKAIAKVNQTIGEAIDNVGNARRELAEWNIDWRELAEAAPDQRLALVARGLLSIEDGARRARAETALFTKNGREVETVLEGVAGGVDKLIDRYIKLRQIKAAEDLLKSKVAADQMTQAMAELERQSTPWVASFAMGVAGLLGLLNKIPGAINNIAQQMARTELSNAGIDPSVLNSDTGSYNGPGAARRASNRAFQLRNAAADLAPTDFLASLRQEASLAQMTAQRRAETLALISVANEKLKQGLVYQGSAADFAGRQAVSMADALKILTPTEAAEVRRLSSLKSSSEQAEKIRVTYAKFISDLKEDARISGETAQNRAAELAVIQAAQVAQKERGVEERNLVQTYAAASKILGATRVNEVQSAVAARTRNELARDILQPLRDEAALAGLTREERSRELNILRLKQQYGVDAVAISEAELRALQKRLDLAEGDALIEDVREHVRLAGLMADEAEREAAVLEGIRATRGEMTDDQAREIRQLVDARREAERMRDTAEDVRGVIAGWFDAGKVSISDISSLFKRELAQMAADALMKPLIMPIIAAISPTQAGVSALMGFGSGSGGGAAGGGLSLGGFGGLGDIGGMLSGGINSLGGMLGFAHQIPGISATFNGMSMSSGAANLGGSLFGSTTLGGAMGMFGMGSMLGGMMGGNSMASGGLGMLGSMAATSLLGGTGIGTALGSFLGPAGMLVGAGLGALLGDFGASNQSSTATFTNGGLGSFMSQTGAQGSTQGVNQAASLISSVISTLQQAGISVGMGGVTGVNVGQEKSYLYTVGGGKQKFGANDIDGVVNAALARILPTAGGGSSEAMSVLNRYMQNGGINAGNISQLQSDFGFAQTLQNLDFSVKQLTQSEQALKAINDQYQALIDKAAALGLSTAKIEDARQGAIDGLIRDFDKGIASSILALTDPQGAARAALDAAQAQRIAEATALGADLADVYRLNTLETEQLIAAQQGLFISNQGLASQAAEMALRAANMNEDVRISILGFTDAQAAALAAEDRAARQRIETAKDAGADLVAVERLNGLARQKVLDDFAEQARQAAERVAAEAAAQASQIQGALTAARGGLSGLVESLVFGADSGMAPDQRYFLLQSRYTQAQRDALANPTSPEAIGAFNTAASAFVPVAREFLGTSQSYGRITGDVLATATQLGGDLSDPSGMGRALVAATTHGSGAIVDAISLTNARLDAMGGDFKKLAAMLQALINRNAA